MTHPEPISVPRALASAPGLSASILCLLALAAACAGSRPAVEASPPTLAAGAQTGRPAERSASGDTDAADDWLGRYSAPSDWALAIVLAPDGSAQIQTTWWGASGSKERRVPARWSREGGELTLRYGEVVDRFAWERAPFEERSAHRSEEWSSGSDAEGALARARLTTLEPVHPRSLVGLAQLWRDEPWRDEPVR